MQRKLGAGALVAPVQALQRLENMRHKRRHPLGQRTASLQERRNGVIEIAAAKVVL
jgi:hypothetical protein